MSSKKGFTLIEILIAVAIIVTLIAVILASLGMVRSKGRDSRRIADIKQIQGAIENYFDSCFSFPEELSDLSIPDCNGNVYINSVPSDPQGGEYGYYKTEDNPKSFHLCATLEFSYGNNKGKAGLGSQFEGDLCNGDPSNGGEKVFDQVGGAYGQ